MRKTFGSAFCIAAVVALSGFLLQEVRADVLYSVTNLGAADTSGSYLGALSQGQQANFRAGSFDSYAHPATVYLSQPFYNSDDIVPYSNDNPTTFLANLTTSNNLGINAGTANTSNPAWTGNDYTQAVVFVPDPHSVSYQNPSLPWWSPPSTESSPGYLYQYTLSNPYQFTGTIAGINDQNNLAWTQSTLVYGSALQTPEFYSSQGSISLGSLGRANGVANALNNSNQVVGWSQIASGAQHAFLYSNGLMQDLNLLIPPLSGITLVNAVGIDSAGEIVAYGTDASGQANEYLLTPLESPVPEPSTLAIMGLMIVAVAARQSYFRRQESRST